MESRIQNSIIISPSICDSSGRLGIPDTASLFMDIAAEHSDILGIGQHRLGAEGGFWLTIKTMMRFHRRPDLGETAVVSTWPEPPEKRRCFRDYLLSGKDGVLAAGKTEWGVLDINTGRLRHLESVYPEGLSLSGETALPDEFVRFEDELTDGELLGTYTVRSTDIDLGKHMNNVAYIRAFSSLFTSDEWNRMDLQFLEIWYRSQCFEKEKLTVRRAILPGREEASFIKEDGTCAAQIRYVPRS